MPTVLIIIEKICYFLVFVAGIKAILAVHFSWEPLMKKKKVATEHLEKCKDKIDEDAYQALKNLIDSI